MLARSADTGTAVESRTDDLGTTDFEGLDLGAYTLVVDRSPRRFEIVLERDMRHEITLPRGVDVHGIVVDIDGTPVAGASVLRLERQHRRAMVLLATSDANGEFVAHGVDEEAHLVARIDGMQPSGAAYVREKVELVLGAVGHRVTGRVVQRDGTPVPFARIAFGVDEDARETREGSPARPEDRPDAKKSMDLDAVLAVADQDGYFESTEVPAGYVLAVARSESPALVGWTQMDLPFGSERSIDVVVDTGGSFTGEVRDTRGDAIQGAVVSIEWEGTIELGQFEDEAGPLVSDPATRTDASGRFAFGGLLPGEYDVRVMLGDFALARHEFTLEEGGTEHWDAAVEHARSVRVHVVGPDGAPLPRWRVELWNGEEIGTPYRRLHETDELGFATLHGLPEAEAYDLAFGAPGPDARYDDVPEAVRRDIAASDDLIGGHRGLRLPSTGIVGRWPVELIATDGLRLQLLRVDFGARIDVPLAPDGSFEVGALSPTSYQLVTTGSRSRRGSPGRIRSFAERETLDLGCATWLPSFGSRARRTRRRRRFHRRERLQVRLEAAREPRNDGLAVLDPRRRQGRDRRALHRGRNVGARERTGPARKYVVVVEAPGFAAATLPVEVATGAPASHRVVVPRGRRIVLDVQPYATGGERRAASRSDRADRRAALARPRDPWRRTCSAHARAASRARTVRRRRARPLARSSGQHVGRRHGRTGRRPGADRARSALNSRDRKGSRRMR
ncbi:MAG: carboxypeptidase regulatory-like domain-containing protein [Planctomycetota bacterium]